MFKAGSTSWWVLTTAVVTINVVVGISNLISHEWNLGFLYCLIGALFVINATYEWMLESYRNTVSDLIRALVADDAH